MKVRGRSNLFCPIADNCHTMGDAAVSPFLYLFIGEVEIRNRHKALLYLGIYSFFTCVCGKNTYNTAMSVRMRHTRGHTRNRRSHHALKEPRLSKDSETGDLHIRHRVNMKTGRYRGRVVIEVAKIGEKKAEKVHKRELESRERGG